MDHSNEEENEGALGLMIARIIVCCVGLGGNFLVIFVITALKEHEKAITHWYVLQLAIADCFFLMTIPFRIAEDTHDEWIFSGTLCKMKESVLFINYYSSILFLMVMSVDRCIAICHASDSRLQKLRRKSSAYIITGIIWMVATLFSVPIMIHSDKRGIDPYCKCMYDFSKNTVEKARCNESELLHWTYEECISHYDQGNLCVKIDLDYGSGDEDYEYESYEYSGGDGSHNELAHEMGCSYAMFGDGWTAYIMFNFIAMFVIPFMLMSICYASIALRFRTAGIPDRDQIRSPNRSGLISRAASNSTSASSRKAKKKVLRVTILCFILVVLFLICWLPFHSVHLAKMRGISASTETCAMMSSITTVIAYMNSALNPYVYNFIGNKFWKRLKLAMKKVATLCKPGSETSSYHSTTTATNGQTISMKLLGRQSVAEAETKLSEG